LKETAVRLSLKFPRNRWLYGAVILLFLTPAVTAHSSTLERPLPKNPVSGKPERIVSLAPNITEMVFSLGRGDALVGVTRHCDHPPAARDLPSVGSYVHLDLERIAALRPDLCLAVKDGNPKETVLRLESLGIPVYAMDPKNLDEVLRTVQELGDLIGARDEAERLLKDATDRISTVNNALSDVSHRPAVFFQVGGPPIVSAGSGTLIDDLITRARGRNLAAGPVRYPKFSREEIIALRPEILIVTSMGGESEGRRALEQWRRWESIPAARNERIFLVDPNLFHRGTLRLVDGLETLAELIHPERFKASP
jgi:iron complex transport system substrate-binding protein